MLPRGRSVASSTKASTANIDFGEYRAKLLAGKGH
jgi:hypothetical protein